MKIKKAKKQDAKEISKMIKQTLSKINVKHYPPEIIDYLKNKNSPERIEKKIIEGIGYVAIEDEKIMGSVFLTSDLVTGLYVKYKLINQGLGKELLKTIEKKAKKLGIKKLFLNVQIVNIIGVLPNI